VLNAFDSYLDFICLSVRCMVTLFAFVCNIETMRQLRLLEEDMESCPIMAVVVVVHN
jgi:hypothetical protein